MTIDEWNAHRAAQLASARTQTPTITCATCGGTLADTSPGHLCMSSPPKFAVHCTGCGWRGWRLA